MRVVSEKTLDVFRAKRRCELCGLPIYDRAEPHHLYPKGMASGSRMDIPENLMSLHHNCHVSVESGNVRKEVLWLIVALREGKTVDEVKAVVYETLRRKN